MTMSRLLWLPVLVPRPLTQTSLGMSTGLDPDASVAASTCSFSKRTVSGGGDGSSCEGCCVQPVPTHGSLEESTASGSSASTLFDVTCMLQNM